MDSKKFEALIDLIINEDEDKARALFHDIVVEKSREIYESMMDEEGMSGQVGDLMDEIDAEESGVAEDDLDLDSDEGGFDGETSEFDADEFDDEEGSEEDLEDRVVDLEDKLDQLMAEFDDIMAGNDEDESDADEDDEFGADEEGSDDEFGADEDTEEAMMEAVQLKTVPGLYNSKIGGDNGDQVRSAVPQNSGQAGMQSRPVKFAGDAESVPTSPKAPSNYGTKGETQVKGAGSFKNAPGSTFKEKGEAAAKPVKTQATGVNTTSPVAESRRIVKKRLK